MKNSYITSVLQQEKKKDGFARSAFLVLIYFLLLYPFQVPGLPVGTAFPVIGVFALFSIYALLKRKNKQRKFRTGKMVHLYWIWNAFLLIYVFCLLQLFGSGSGTTPTKDYIQMLIILPLFYISGSFLFRNIEELMKILYMGVIIQSSIIIIALFSPTLTIALTLFFPENSYFNDFHGGFEQTIAEGYKIGLGVFSSAGSLKMAIGQIGACFYLINSKGPKLFFHLFLYLLIAIASSMVSRTGLLVSIVGLFVIFITKRKQGGAYRYVILLFFSLLLGYFAITLFFSNSFISETFQRLIKTADVGIHDTYFRGFLGEGGDNNIPSISIETIVGLGITYGTSGHGITTITDGGFMRNYSAMGLIVAIINYLIITSFFMRRYKASKSCEFRGIILFMALVLLIGEFKEYYIYYISPMCFIFLIFSLLEKEERVLINHIPKLKRPILT